MRHILYIIILFEMCICNGQTGLKGASVRTEITNSNIQLEEELILDIPDSITTLSLKALLFTKIKPRINEVIVNGKKNKFEQIQEKGLVVLRITSEITPIKNIIIIRNNR